MNEELEGTTQGSEGAESQVFEESFDIAPEGDEQSVQNLEEVPAEDTGGSQEQSQEVEEPKGGEETPSAPEEAPQEEDDVTSLRAQLAAAQAELFQLRGRPSAQPQATQPQVEQPKLDVPKTASEVTTVDFLGDQDHVAILEDRSKFNNLLNVVATTAFNAALTAAQERILRQIPAVVETAAQQQMQINNIVGDFYNANKDLVAYKPAVSMAAIKLHNANPQMPLEELLAKAASETRKMLRLQPAQPSRPRKPAQPIGSGRAGMDRATPQSPNLSSMEQQILAMLSDM